MKSCLPFVIILGLFGCSKEQPSPVNQTADSTVHLAGEIGNSVGYWKNGVYTDLFGTMINSMYVDGLSVVIGGWDVGDATLHTIIWLNGEATTIEGAYPGLTLVASRDNNLFGVWYVSNPRGWVLYKYGAITRISSEGWASAIALHGDDVYIAGASHGNDYPWMVSPFYPLDTYALCWKNEQVVFRDTVHSSANTIFVHHDDVYMGGHLNHYPSLDRVACYWKNGLRFKLTEENQDAEVTSLFVTDTHLYAAGVINDQAVYWKDGVATFLSSGGISSKANSISVLGTDVYVAGKEDKYPAVWKNGIKQNISTQDTQGEIKVVVAVSN